MEKNKVKNKSSPVKYVILLSQSDLDKILDLMSHLKDNDKDFFNFLYHLEFAEFTP